MGTATATGAAGVIVYTLSTNISTKAMDIARMTTPTTDEVSFSRCADSSRSPSRGLSRRTEK